MPCYAKLPPYSLLSKSLSLIRRNLKCERYLWNDFEERQSFSTIENINTSILRTLTEIVYDVNIEIGLGSKAVALISVE